MYDPNTGTFRFTLFYYTQFRDGIPVFRSDLRLLVRNEAQSPLVLAASSLRNLGAFTVPLQRPAAPPIKQIVPGMDRYGPLETVIFAGVDDQPHPPTLAVTFTAERGTPADSGHEGWLYVLDAASGAILHRENQIHRLDVTGNVSGTITDNYTSAACAAATTRALPYARVAIDSTAAFADVNGNFVIPNAGSTQVAVTGGIQGQYFVVNNDAQANDALTVNVTPPGPANLLFNTDTEFRHAERDAYFHANVVRDFVLGINPAYPTIGAQTGFQIFVNGSSCNAGYFPFSTTMRFGQANANCLNTATGTIVYHEYGHHLVRMGGSGQGGYGEGMGDAISMIITGVSTLGDVRGCNQPERNADNPIQYPCTDEIHTCGQVLSGCIWETWHELKLTHPDTADSVIRDLTVNSIMLHTGESIDPEITIDFLTLDDDDANLENGTPHQTEILAGFGKHNMHPWGGSGNFDSADFALPICPGDTIVYSTSQMTKDTAASCSPYAEADQGRDAWFVYTPQTSGQLTASVCDGTDFVAVLSVYLTPPGQGGSEMACDKDGCCSFCGGIISMPVNAGESYYIHVGGLRFDLHGTFTLALTGPPCMVPLQITLPNGAPSELPSQFKEKFGVSILPAGPAQSYQPGTALLHYRYDQLPFKTVPLIEEGGGSFTAELPPGPCGQIGEFFVSARTDQYVRVTAPGGAPDDVYRGRVGAFSVVLLDDNFETDHGWTVSGNASDGQWQRAVPRNCGRGDPPADFDGSGQCYVTDNGNCLSDVDGGATILTSPAISLAGLTDSFVGYAYWFNSNAADDEWLVEIRQNAGPWIEAQRHAASTAWRRHQFRVADFVPATGNIEVRFTADDKGLASVVEAAIDAFVVGESHCDPVCPGDFDNDHDIDLEDVEAFTACASGANVPVTPPCAVMDLDGDLDADVDDFGILQRCFTGD